MELPARRLGLIPFYVLALPGLLDIIEIQQAFFAYCNKGEKSIVLFHGYGILKNCFINSELPQEEFMPLLLRMCNATRICDAMPTELSVVL